MFRRFMTYRAAGARDYFLFDETTAISAPLVKTVIR